MDKTKYYIWVSTTIIVTAVFLAGHDFFLAILTLVLSYIFWNIPKK